MQKVIIMLLITISLLTGCTRTPQVEYTQYDYSSLSNNELITLYYGVDLELQESLEIREQFRENSGGLAGYDLGCKLRGEEPLSTKIKRLRRQQAAILAEMCKRGIQLPR